MKRSIISRFSTRDGTECCLTLDFEVDSVQAGVDFTERILAPLNFAVERISGTPMYSFPMYNHGAAAYRPPSKEEET